MPTKKCDACQQPTKLIKELKELRCLNEKCTWYCETLPFVFFGNDTLRELYGN